MNERIKELAEQTGVIFIPASVDYFGEQHPAGILTDRINIEKFAELIIRECAKVCNDIDIEYEGEDVSATWCAAAIKQHFGVK